MFKKLLLAVIPAMMLAGCAPEAQPQLPPVEGNTFTVVLDASNSTLTTADSDSLIAVELHAKEDDSITYQLEIGAPCYLKTVSDGTNNYTEIILKEGAFIRSKSEYKVQRLILDIWKGQGINYEVFPNADGTGTKLVEHTSEITPVYEADNGAVYEYEVNSTGWDIVRFDRKPGIYSVTIVFEIE